MNLRNNTNHETVVFITGASNGIGLKRKFSFGADKNDPMVVSIIFSHYNAVR
jgi:NADP-dependent 3-hydroxy acid dehydrogenase YdfG